MEYVREGRCENNVGETNPPPVGTPASPPSWTGRPFLPILPID